jgi:membrane protein implicated in regulation of membrane protease activity
MEKFLDGALVIITAVWLIISSWVSLLLSLVFEWVFDNWRVTVGIWAVLVLMALWQIRNSIDAKGK